MSSNSSLLQQIGSPRNPLCAFHFSIKRSATSSFFMTTDLTIALKNSLNCSTLVEDLFFQFDPLDVRKIRISYWNRFLLVFELMFLRHYELDFCHAVLNRRFMYRGNPSECGLAAFSDITIQLFQIIRETVAKRFISIFHLICLRF